MNQLIYVDLDMLLDTRIAVVDQLSTEAAIEILNKGRAYRTRNSDQLHLLTEHITEEAYVKAYRKRDRTVLMRSRITPMMFAFAEAIKEQVDVYLGNTIDRVIVHVNQYPFKLLDNERVAMIECIQTYIGFEPEISFIDVPLMDLSLAYLANHGYTGLFLYPFRDWVELHVPNVKEGDKLIPQTTLITPRLMISEKIDTTGIEKMHDQDGNTISPEQTVRMALAPAISVQFVDPALICIMDIDDVNASLPPEMPKTDKPKGAPHGSEPYTDC